MSDVINVITGDVLIHGDLSKPVYVVSDAGQFVRYQNYQTLKEKKTELPGKVYRIKPSYVIINKGVSFVYTGGTFQLVLTNTSDLILRLLEVFQIQSGFKKPIVPGYSDPTEVTDINDLLRNNIKRKLHRMIHTCVREDIDVRVLLNELISEAILDFTVDAPTY